MVLYTGHNHLLILPLWPHFHNMNLLQARCCWTLAQVMCLTRTSPLLTPCLWEHLGIPCQVIHKAPNETGFLIISRAVINGYSPIFLKVAQTQIQSDETASPSLNKEADGKPLMESYFSNWQLSSVRLPMGQDWSEESGVNRKTWGSLTGFDGLAQQGSRLFLLGKQELWVEEADGGTMH